MKACVIQPPYSYNTADCESCFQFKMDQLHQCDPSMDLIVLPEYSDVPCVTSDLEETLYYHQKYIAPLLEECIATAKRCNALVFVNALSKEEGGYRNTTYAYDRQGNLAGKYFKKHLPPLELEILKLDSDYTFEPSFPTILEIEGLRFAFLTCYDFYFYEAFAAIARENPDIIIGCSLQRSDSHAAIETMCRFLAYNTNAYVLRSSVSFSEDSPICGSSMIVAPDGAVLANLKAAFGRATAEFDPAAKHLKPGGFGNPDCAHHQYIEYGRKPWQYRLGGAGILPFEPYLKYPRICAHRGFNTIAPENSLAAWGAAIGLGAQEIELDLWATKDGVLVSCHDSTLDRVSNGSGKIYDHTFEELSALDFGAKCGEAFRGMTIPTFEEILKKFGGRAIMNIHVKIWDAAQEKDYLEEIVGLIRRYDCQKHVYFMTSNDAMIRKAQCYAPEIPCCVGWDGNKEDPMAIVHRALALGAAKVQFFKPYFNREAVAFAKENGLICNVFWSDDPQEAKEFLEMGIDTILTNDYQRIANALKDQM